MYQLKLTPKAQHQLDKLPAQYLERIVAGLKRLKDNPRPSGAKKLRDFIYRMRTGDWRIIYAIFDKDNLIIIGKIARRAEDTYDRMKELF